MQIPLDEVYHFDAITSHPSTGAVTDADSTPTWSIFEEDTDTAILAAQNFTKRTSLTGNYRGAATLSTANGFEVGKWYNVIASATVNAIAGKAVVGRFRVILAEAVAGVNKVDVTHISGDSVAADNAESFFDGTGYAGTNNVIPSVTTVTTVSTVTTVTNGVSIATGGIVAGSFATGAITATVIAADAIGTSEFSTAVINAIADQVWDEVLSGHLTASTTGFALNAAGSAGDPWGTALPGSYIAGTAGFIIGTNLNATVSSRSTLSEANIRTAVGLASANLDTQLAAIAGFIDTEITTANTNISTILGQTTTTGVVVATASKTGYALSATGVDLVLVESGITGGAGLTNDTGTQLTSINLRQAAALFGSALVGVLSGVSTSAPVFKQAGKPSGSSRIVATTTADGRTAVTLKVPD